MTVYAICPPAFDLSKHHTCDMVTRPLDSVKNYGIHTIDTTRRYYGVGTAPKDQRWNHKGTSTVKKKNRLSVLNWCLQDSKYLWVKVRHTFESCHWDVHVQETSTESGWEVGNPTVYTDQYWRKWKSICQANCRDLCMSMSSYFHFQTT